MESKSIRLDVLFEDERGWYDIEMQVENRENLPKRSRYYGAGAVRYHGGYRRAYEHQRTERRRSQ